ncbi:MAG: hypothetical protein CO162_02580 [bacterium (Candidatus Ratteibacteria) CG_4_9_14_3_um_filter_41_21]|uniref:Nucleotidyl transferase AbiEii/AbiGii toxin family protein n=2 Tax=Candidatus Ratteibacteria TaxID=2979319 RepID=A0A2M7YGS4_9BACT|nr:MAG: hypothetical protein COS11_06605 [bacterium (Candidatus Ratteibacteria) CG01_land_8_20_14_3_00_40_19]PJA62157.1 MAG: hypothetical protein CO162_02580 [bacterium (Candidatus Ratteibacteria) CG_4_9_14_3_um_filter_41_21]
MLTRKQIETLAKRFGVGLSVQERDYIQYVFLYLLFKNSQDFYFKGGTCLKVVYGLPRYSEDLDFNSNLAGEDIYKRLKRAADELKTFGIEGIMKEEKFLRFGFTFDLSFGGIRYNGRDRTKNKIRVDVSMRKEKVKREEKIIYPRDLYPDIPTFSLTCLSLEDIFTEKLRALLVRNKPRDLWDVWFLLERKKKLDIELINKKLSLYNLKFNRERLRESIEKLEGVWEKDLSALLAPGQLPRFKMVKEKIISYC